ncbi:DTW domain-containing protein 2 [Phalaenopsis equestris]|uniref:DTW domain-containing protein 2 n=1 Tax=Phalaenopsis equestris TaxID=78828 RepID=UPI0009E5C883|nr:DTW domain-containing protein 2 [Phalaenopsis equestris]
MEEEFATLPQSLFFSSDEGEENSIRSNSKGYDFTRQEEQPHRRTRQQRRAICWSGCRRPDVTCICPFLPPSPIHTSTTLIILHHPHELRTNKLATLPALSRSLIRCHSILGRRLHPGSSPLLDRHSSSPSSSSPVLFLFPTFDSSTPGFDIERWAADTPPDARAEPILIVFDATWRYAKEMVVASIPFLSRFSIQVQVGDGCDTRSEGPSTYESGLVLRKEPWKGCLSTMEAVARVLRVLEPEGNGVEIEERLLTILRAMVAFQACHLKTVMPRQKLKKKGQALDSCPPVV